MKRQDTYQAPKRCETCMYSVNVTQWYNMLGLHSGLPNIHCMYGVTNGTPRDEIPMVHKGGLCDKWEEVTGSNYKSRIL